MQYMRALCRIYLTRDQKLKAKVRMYVGSKKREYYVNNRPIMC